MNWLRQLFARRQIYRDLSEEIQQHLAEKVDALMAEGMSRRDAEYAAKRDFGNVARIEESGHEPWMWPRAESILADIRFAVRKLRHSPGFALTAILTLAFGIGANVVVLSVLNALILRPLPLPQAERLFNIVNANHGDDNQSYPDYLDYRAHNTTFTDMAAYRLSAAGLSAGGTAKVSWNYEVSGNYFDMLGVQPVLGRRCWP
jgi:hypothetical protein